MTMKNTIYSGIYKNGPSGKTYQFIVDPNMEIVENKLLTFYLWETIAHNLMLAKQGIVPKEISKKILKNLLLIKDQVQKNKIRVEAEIGDVHENIENKLTEMMGQDAGWFHIGRSRNDQALTDQKLFIKESLLNFFESLNELNTVLLNKSESHKEVVMPGFTHLRVAMPTSFGFWWQAYLDQVLEIQEILQTEYLVVDKSSLGVGASYGVNWKINPNFTAKKLGFSKVFNNALSAINSRGIHESLIIGTLTTFHMVLSRMMEDIIIWSMPELNYLSISEEFTTGSSIMPQKMNPDIAEKIRSKAAKLIGDLTYIMTAMKGTPSGYNRDSAESKIAVMDALEEAQRTLSITTDMLEKIIPNVEIMKKAVLSSLPTKLADILVEDYHFPFRTAHKIVGRSISLVKGDVLSITPGVVSRAINEIAAKQINIPQELLKQTFNINKALDHYQYLGTPNPNYVTKVNVLLKKSCDQFKHWTVAQIKKNKQAESELYKEVKKYISG